MLAKPFVKAANPINDCTCIKEFGIDHSLMHFILPSPMETPSNETMWQGISTVFKEVTF